MDNNKIIIIIILRTMFVIEMPFVEQMAAKPIDIDP